MAKSSTRRVTIYINGKEVEASVIFGFFVFSPPPKPPPMNRCRPYRLVYPLQGCVKMQGNALGYRYASPNGDKGCNNQHLGARHVPATMLPQLGDNTHILFTATPPQCDGASTTLNSPLSTLNSSHTFSAKERDLETGLSYFGSRYYSSDLSIWLSVDPMSGKYPSFSPYVYCANNPVKLVDPDGRQWESKADEEKALSLIEQAQDNQKTIYASIKMITSKKELSSRDKAMLNDLISQYQYLSEGIANLNDMGSSTEETFHFSNLPSIDEGCVHKRQDGVIDIIHSSDAMAWHECVHFGDYKKNLNWNFDKNGYLATAPDNYAASEYKAYESQFSFDNTSLKYSNGTTVQSISQVKIWVKFHGYDVK